MKKGILIGLLVLCLIAAAGVAIYISNSDKPDDGEEIETIDMLEDLEIDEIDDEDSLESEDAEEEPEADYTPEDDTVISLEAALPALAREGYNKMSDGGYKITETVEGIKSVRIIHASGNHLEVDLDYDYGSDNQEMIKFFKANEDDAVSIMVSSFLTRLAEYANAEEGDMSYVIKIAGKQVQKGKMTVAQAFKYQEMLAE